MTEVRIRRVEHHNRALSTYGVGLRRPRPSVEEPIYAITGQSRGDLATRWDSTD